MVSRKSSFRERWFRERAYFDSGLSREFRERERWWWFEELRERSFRVKPFLQERVVSRERSVQRGGLHGLQRNEVEEERLCLPDWIWEKQHRRLSGTLSRSPPLAVRRYYPSQGGWTTSSARVFCSMWCKSFGCVLCFECEYIVFLYQTLSLTLTLLETSKILRFRWGARAFPKGWSSL